MVDTSQDVMNFTCVCQWFVDLCTLAKVQRQEASRLNKFHVTYNAWIIKILSLTHMLLLHSNKIYSTLSLSQAYKHFLLNFGEN